VTREVEAVTVSMRVMSAGDGYRYLLRTVVIGDADHRLSTPLTRYYAGAYRSRAATTAPCAAVGPGCATETGGPSHVSTRTGRWNSAATAHDGRRA